MPDTRIDAVVIAGGILLWIGIFVASWHGMLGVSGRVTDTVLASLAFLIGYRIWRVCRGSRRRG